MSYETLKINLNPDENTIKNTSPLSKQPSKNNLKQNSTMNTLHFPTVLQAVLADVCLKLVPYHRELDIELETFYRELEAEKSDSSCC
jgi:hypothetical protein